MNTYKVYLAGPIGGLTYKEGSSWRDYVRERLPSSIQAYSPLRGKEYLKNCGLLTVQPYNQNPLSTAAGVVGRDRNDVLTTDVMLVNLLGATRVSIGTCIEFGWADAFRKPIVLVMEESLNPHEHLILTHLPVYRTPSLDEGIQLVKSILLPHQDL